MELVIKTIQTRNLQVERKFFRNSVYSGKFPVERTKKSCSFTCPNRNSRNIFGKWKTNIHTQIPIVLIMNAYAVNKGRDTRCDATGCCNKSPRVTCENHCHCDRILSLRSVARIQTGLPFVRCIAVTK